MEHMLWGYILVEPYARYLARGLISLLLNYSDMGQSMKRGYHPWVSVGQSMKRGYHPCVSNENWQERN